LAAKFDTAERQSGYLFIPVPRAAHSHGCGCIGADSYAVGGVSVELFGEKPVWEGISLGPRPSHPLLK